ncbi:MAG: prephenate dehydratase domain-containing protein [Bacillota bacterium]
MKNEYIYSTLGTLGDSNGFLTCSMHVAKEWNKASLIKPYSLFEYAADAVKEGNLSCLLVPGAYPKINSLIMDKELSVTETFIKEIPSLVLVGINESMPTNVEVIYHHPATTDLLSEVKLSFDEHQNASSNSEACIKLLNSSKNAVAITNQICAKHYKLNIYQVLRTGIDMPWICFTKKESKVLN